MKQSQKETELYGNAAGYLHEAFNGNLGPLERLTQLARLGQVVEQATQEVGQKLANQARRQGVTWEEIAKAVGLTKQMAWHRWAEKTKKEVA